MTSDKITHTGRPCRVYSVSPSMDDIFDSEFNIVGKYRLIKVGQTRLPIM
jgi:hypothetical protein